MHTLLLAIVYLSVNVIANMQQQWRLSQDAHSLIDWSSHQYIPPAPGDLRSPCPGLNTLANHGFLPRDGRGIRTRMVLHAIDRAFNQQPNRLAVLAIKLGLLTTDAPDSFTLDDLKLHGTIEHDASLSRSDHVLGDNLNFNESIFESTFAPSDCLTMSSDYYDTQSAGKAIRKRLEEAKKVNPNATHTVKEFASSLLESSLYLSAMGDAVSGEADKRFVQIFFREERLPIEEGWRRPSVGANETTLIGLMEKIAPHTNWTRTPGCPWTRLQPEGGVTTGVWWRIDEA